jgi:uncharacterized membrane protein YqjE
VLTWLTGHPIMVIAAIVFAAVYLLAAFIIVSLAIASRHGIDHAFKGISGVALGPVSVTFALLVGFLGADVWPTFDRSSSALGVEAARLRQALVVADALSGRARRQRILLSQATVGGTMVFILVLLAGLVLLTIAIVHAENRGAQIITAAIFATAAAACMFTILVYDRPFGGGGISLSPGILIEVRPD